MVGLSIVLETTNTLCDGVTSPRPHQVVCKATVVASVAAADTASLRRGSWSPESGFLERCFLCRRKLLPAKDIYMYKGDKAFCSVECRSRKMIMDEEESLRRENHCSSMAVKTTKPGSPAPSPSSSGGFPRHRRDPRNRAGGFAY